MHVLQFSLRSALVSVSVCCVALGAFAVPLYRYRSDDARHLKVRTALEAMGVRVSGGREHIPAPYSWFVGTLSGERVWSVGVGDYTVLPQPSDKIAIPRDKGFFEVLRALDRYVLLDFASTDFNDDDFRQLRGLRVHSLHLEYTSMNDDVTAEEWSQVVGVRSVNVAGTGIGDVTIAVMCQTQELRRLDISNCTRVTDIGLTALAQETGLEQLWIYGIPVTAEGLRDLQKSQTRKVYFER